MRLRIVYLDGTKITLNYVQTVTLRARHRIEVTCFGNGPVMHYNVQSYSTEYEV